jgi:hypothetical protein
MPTPHRPNATLAALLEALPAEARRALCPGSELRRRAQGELRSERLLTGLEGLDRLLGGGLPRGELVELVGRGSCGRLAALLEAVRAASGAGEVVALVDLGAGFDPQAAAELGVDLARVLWLRPRRLAEALSAAETAASAGFPLVAVELGLPPVPGRAPLAAWLRLARSAADHAAVVLVSSPYHLSGCAAKTVVEAGRGRGRWVGSLAGPRLLAGLSSRLSLTRRRGHGPSEAVAADFSFPGTLLPSPVPTATEVPHAAAR